MSSGAPGLIFSTSVVAGLRGLEVIDPCATSIEFLSYQADHGDRLTDGDSRVRRADLNRVVGILRIDAIVGKASQRPRVLLDVPSRRKERAKLVEVVLRRRVDAIEDERGLESLLGRLLCVEGNNPGPHVRTMAAARCVKVTEGK
jgi:hypothetical protein